MNTLYVAEMGSQHKGSTALACRYAYEMKNAGADIIKMQFGHDPADPVRHVSREMAETMARYCDSIGIELMASIFSQEGLELARLVGMKRYKVAHQINANRPLIESILGLGKETFVAYVNAFGQNYGAWSNERSILTTDKYPTLPGTFSMTYFQGRNAPNSWYGYSDHCIGIGACLWAVALDAKYIEKHVALDPTDLATKDTAFSATPAQFAELVRLGREIEQVRDAAA